MTKQPTHERVEAARLISARYATGHMRFSIAEQRVLADGFDALYAIACLGLTNDALAPEAELTPEEAKRSREQLAMLDDEAKHRAACYNAGTARGCTHGWVHSLPNVCKEKP